MPAATRVFLALMLAVCLVGAAGCTSKGNDKKEEALTIQVIVKKTDADFWKVVRMGTQAASQEFNVTVNFTGPTDEQDIEGQIGMVNDAVTARADAIVLAACDYNRLVDAVNRAVEAGIPVIVIDSDVNTTRTNGFVGTDNVDAGRRLGDTLVEKVGRQCKVAVMGFVRGAATCDQREQGLLEVLSTYPGIQALDTVYCGSDSSYAKILTQQIIEENPDIDAIVCLNAYGTEGVAQGVDESKTGRAIRVIGFDSTPTEIRYLEKDVVQALVIQNPYKMGYLGVKYALDTIRGKKMPQNVNTGLTIIDKGNMYLPENQKLLFPFIS